MGDFPRYIMTIPKNFWEISPTIPIPPQGPSGIKTPPSEGENPAEPGSSEHHLREVIKGNSLDLWGFFRGFLRLPKCRNLELKKHISGDFRCMVIESYEYEGGWLRWKSLVRSMRDLRLDPFVVASWPHSASICISMHVITCLYL